MSLEVLVRRWRQEMRFLGLIKPNTDISHIKDEDFELRPCACGCSRKVKILKSSPTKFFSSECKRKGAGKAGRKDAWHTSMDYMIRG